MKYLVMFLMSASAANAAEKAGMPQLDITGWGPQIFWLFLTFTILYIVVWKIVVPRLSDSIEQRNDYISDNLEDAKKIANDAENLNKSYETTIANTRNEAAKIIINNKKNLNEKLLKEKNQLEAKLQKKTEEIEKEISKMKNNSINDIKNIAGVLSGNIIHDVTGEKISDDKIKKIIEKLITNQSLGLK